MSNRSTLIAAVLASLASTATLAQVDPALAHGNLAVLDFTNKLSAKERAEVDANYFTDIVRDAALKTLPGLKVMTRENLIVLLQANGKDLASCEGECEVDTGRRIGADLIISGELLKIGSSFKLNLRLHETRDGRMLSGEIASGKTVDELDENTVAAVQRLLAPLHALIADAQAAPETPLIRDANSPAQAPSSQLIRDANSPAQAPSSQLIRDANPPAQAAAPSGAPSATASPAPNAPPSALPPTGPRRHTGFLFRGELGGAYLSTSAGSATVSGGAALLGLEASYAVAEDNYLGVILYDTIAVNPSVSTPSATASTENTSLSSYGFGPSYTHYFMPINLYVDLAVAVTGLSSEVNGTQSSASVGFGAHAALGKEWWIGRRFGVCAAAQVSYASNGDNGATDSTVAVGLAVSATYSLGNDR